MEKLGELSPQRVTNLGGVGNKMNWRWSVVQIMNLILSNYCSNPFPSWGPSMHCHSLDLHSPLPHTPFKIASIAFLSCLQGWQQPCSITQFTAPIATNVIAWSSFLQAFSCVGYDSTDNFKLFFNLTFIIFWRLVFTDFQSGPDSTLPLSA